MISTLLALHFAFVPIVLVAGASTTIAGMLLYILGRGARQAPALLARAFRVLLWTTAGIGVVQALWGALLFLTGCRPGDDLHYVYGAIVLLAIPVAYVYSDQKDVRRDIIIMTIAAVAVIGAGARAFMTGPGVCH